MIKCPKCGHNKFAVDVNESNALTYRNCTIENNYFEPEWVKDWGYSDFHSDDIATCENCGHKFNYEESVTNCYIENTNQKVNNYRVVAELLEPTELIMP